MTWNMAASLTGAGWVSEGAQQLHEPFLEIQVDHVVQGRTDRREIRRHFRLPIAHDPRFRAAVGALASKDRERRTRDRKSTRLNSSHLVISYAVFCLKKKKKRSRTPGPSQP